MRDRDELRKRFMSDQGEQLDTEALISQYNELKVPTAKLVRDSGLSTTESKTLMQNAAFEALLDQLVDAGVINRARYNYDRLSNLHKALTDRVSQGET